MKFCFVCVLFVVVFCFCILQVMVLQAFWPTVNDRLLLAVDVRDGARCRC